MGAGNPYYSLFCGAKFPVPELTGNSVEGVVIAYEFETKSAPDTANSLINPKYLNFRDYQEIGPAAQDSQGWQRRPWRRGF
jgi:hypothetical protein